MKFLILISLFFSTQIFSKNQKSKRSIASAKISKEINGCLGKTVTHNKFGYVGHCQKKSNSFLILEINKKLFTFHGVKRNKYQSFLKSSKKFSFYKKFISGKYKYSK